MKHSGTIKLIEGVLGSGDENILRELGYQSLKHRAALINSWRMQYGKRFLYLAIQIAPDEPIEIKQRSRAKRLIQNKRTAFI
jgi:hypothetical protein